MIERRPGGELRAEGRRLTGTVMRFGDVSPSHRERFEPGAFAFAEAVPLNLFHDPERAVAWRPGGGLELRQDRDSLAMTATLPRSRPRIAPGAGPAGRGDGLVGRISRRPRAPGHGLRVIEAATLSGIGIVRSPSYQAKSRVEARARSGRTIRARVPVDTDLECRCSGVVLPAGAFYGG